MPEDLTISLKTSNRIAPPILFAWVRSEAFVLAVGT